MSYLPAIEKADVVKSENQFLIFSFVSTLFLLIILSSFFITCFDNFWLNNKLWATGSLIVFISVLQARFFNIKNNAASDNRHFNSDDFRKGVKYLEKFYGYIWIIGFVLIASSRWIKL